MYLPYLRGKENELRALKELLENNLLSKKIIPIIEPINFSSIFKEVLLEFIKKEREIIVIHNPQVGDFFKIDKKSIGEFDAILKNKFIIIGHILNEKSNIQLKEIQTKGLDVDNIALIENKNNSINKNSLKSFRSRFIVLLNDDYKCDNRVILDDKFDKKNKNADYLEREEFFSDEHIKYLKRHDLGFSDYSVIGEKFSNSGWLAKVVAIHIVYFDNNILNIRHFLSDSNDSTENQSKKVREANKKLCEWADLNKFDSLALQKFREYNNQNKSTSLGMLKRLSIMHHLEIMSKYLDKLI